MKKQMKDNKINLSKIVAGVMNWGYWGAKLNKREMAVLIQQCVELGITSFDHADIYGGYTTESDFGDAFHESKIERQNIEIVTKCAICIPTKERPEFKIKSYNTTKKYIIDSVERSLRNLQTDYIDVLLIHRPSPIMDFEVMADALTTLQESSKILHAGVSNFTPIQTETFLNYFPIITNQVEASLLHLEPFLDGSFDVCQKHKIKPMAWSPLGGGKLFHSKTTTDDVKRDNKFSELSKKWGIPLDELAYVFLLHHPAGILPVTGSSKIKRIKSAVNALDHQLSNEQWFELWIASIGQDVP